MKYKSLIVIILLSVFSSCKYFRGDKCNNTLPPTGVYYNSYDEDAEHILIIKKDGTFEQKYTKGDITEKNNGTWKFFKERCEFKFDKLAFLQNVPDCYVKDSLYEFPAIHRTNNIYFIDHHDISFYRK